MKYFAKIAGMVTMGLLGGCSHSPTNASDLGGLCQPHPVKIVGRYTPSVTPKYFFKSVGTAHEIAFAGYAAESKADQNILFDLKTGKLTPIPGEFDPIGLFKTDLLSVPTDNGEGRTAMKFYDLRELRRLGVKAKPIFETDTSLMGRYQSLGVLERDGQRVKFRVITDGDLGGNFRDFEVDFGSEPAKMKALRKTQPLCKNLRNKKSHQLDYKLPMLSKDGKRLSLFDLSQQKMKIFDFNPASSQCTEVPALSLNRGDIGKLDFNPDGSQVAFHYSDRSLELSPLTFGTPESYWQLRSAVYDLNKKTYQLLPFLGKGANTLYPTFHTNGNLLFLETEGERYSFVEVDLKSIPAIPHQAVEALIGLSDLEFAPYQKLSNLFVEKCFSEAVQSFRANRLLNLLALGPESCLKLASGDPALQKVCRKLAQINDPSLH